MARRVPVGAVAAESDPPSPAIIGAGAAKTAAAAPAKSVHSVISPPPDVRCIVDKTAEFVAQNGIEFEKQILSNEKRNPRFNFLKAKDAYHSYYQHRILDFIDRAQSPAKALECGAPNGGE